METINQFNWPEVAAIAGGALVCLMALVGVLLAIILRRTTKQEDNGNGVIAQVKEIQSSVEGKIDSLENKIDREIDERKQDFASLRSCVTEGRAERRLDINTLHKKLEMGLDKAVDDFRVMCEFNSKQCSATQRAELQGTKDRVDIQAQIIDRLEKDKMRRWDKQELLNRSFASKIAPGV